MATVGVGDFSSWCCSPRKLEVEILKIRVVCGGLTLDGPSIARDFRMLLGTCLHRLVNFSHQVHLCSS
jgi:hypothetical protein